VGLGVAAPLPKSFVSMAKAACTAAARFEAPAGAPAGSTRKNSYFGSMPLTASNTATCTSAAIRVIVVGDVPATSPARSMTWFQSVTSSAPACGETPTHTSATATILNIFFMCPPACRGM
jgi:hypothetical protein